jgi:hypothetical protein
MNSGNTSYLCMTFVCVQDVLGTQHHLFLLAGLIYFLLNTFSFLSPFLSLRTHCQNAIMPRTVLVEAHYSDLQDCSWFLNSSLVILSFLTFVFLFFGDFCLIFQLYQYLLLQKFENIPISFPSWR